VLPRSVPLIVVASASAGVAEEAAARLRRDGNVVYVTHSAQGCLRVATSVAPDMVLLDPRLPSRLIGFLRAHPATADAQILHLGDALRPAIRHGRALTVPATAPHHAA
jgi:CheY-like chemotaxis protein